MISASELEHDYTENDPVHRLVGAIVGSSNRNNEHMIALANRVLSSQIGTNSKDNCNDGVVTDLSSTWRRISRKARKPNAKEEIEKLYSLYEKEFSTNENPDQPAKVIVTLTKLMGKRIPTTSVSSKQTTIVERQRQTQPKMTPRLTTTATNKTSMGTTALLGSSIKSHGEMSRPPTVSRVRKQSTLPRVVLSRNELQQEEEKLLKECLYSLQAIDGERIQYYHRDPKDNSLPNISNYEGIRIESPVLSQNILYTGQISETRLGSGALDALRICGEAGWLYARIKSYIHQVQQDRGKGVVARAFAETLAEQLRDYHSLLTTYETKLPGFTLRQMLVELQGPTFRLKTLAMLVDGMQELTGGYLLSALYKHSIHGNTVHTGIVRSILAKASRPWFEILYGWTTKGILSDPWKEFFVVENTDVEERYLWNNKYSINYDLVPIGILDQKLVKPAFNVGKGINFIRRCLLDGQWTMQLLATSGTSDERMYMEKTLGYRYESNEYENGENAALKKTFRTAMGLVHSHILSALRDENHLMQHLFALKQFFLLGQGDFFSALMEGLHNEFRQDRDYSSGMNGIYQHSLLMIVEGALRSTNAKYLPQYIIERLQVELIVGPGEEHVDTLTDQRRMFDIFMFDYQVPDPVLSIIHTVAMERYKMVFSLLFRLKHIEFMLNYTWRQSATLQHALQTSAQYTGIDLSSSKGYARATFLLRNISILRQSMTHLIVNLKSYLMFEVIEGGWQKLESVINNASTLDEAIEAHDNYLDSIIRKAMVRVSESDDSSQQNVLANQVEIVLTIANEFCSLQETLFNRSLKEAELTAQKRVEAESRLRRGQWGFDTQRDVSGQEHFFGLSDGSIMDDVSRISNDYNDHALALLRALNERVDGNDGDLSEKNDGTWQSEDFHPQRFLIAQLDHNNFYAKQVPA
jgi:gamma-tubulin complex component 3